MALLYNKDDLSALITDGLAKATAAGIQLEDHEIQALHDQLHESLNEFFAGVAPVLERIDAVNASLATVAELVATLNAGGTLETEITVPGLAAPIRMSNRIVKVGA